MVIHSRESTTNDEKQAPDYSLPPRVLIVGAGLGGLLLAILREHAKIPYKVFERAQEAKPIGLVVTLNAQVQGVLEQLGIYDDLVKVSLPVLELNIYNEKLKLIMKNGPMNNKELLGYEFIVFPRPALFDLLLARIPKEKIVFKKKILKTE
ncbi:hypothetical protein BG003_001432 [Podila horticola]|nr:hypothetical protein BG003_001432 [Podila horticola]